MILWISLTIVMDFQTVDKLLFGKIIYFGNPIGLADAGMTTIGAQITRLRQRLYFFYIDFQFWEQKHWLARLFIPNIG